MVLGRGGWTFGWDASTGLYPDQVTPPWVREQESGTTIDLQTTADGKVLLFDNIASFPYRARFNFTPALLNDHGWAVEFSVKVERADVTTGNPTCGIFVADGTKRMQIQILVDQVKEMLHSLGYTMDTTDGFHTYRLEGKGSDFRLYVDGKLAIDGRGMLTDANPAQILRFGIVTGDKPARHFWKFIRVNPNHDVEYASTGTYTSQTFDLGTQQNNVGSGAKLSYTGQFPMGSTVVIKTRTSDSPDGPWSEWQTIATDGTIASPQGRYVQVQIVFATMDSTVTPQIDNFTIQYCGY